jgi:putative DNA primase/helicase
MNNLFSQKGSLQDWQRNVAGPCAPHTRLVLAIAAALVGPLLKPMGAEGGGFHLYGPSSIGKSTALRLAASVWGHPIAFTGTWRATDNGLEAVAMRRCDTFFPIDELSEVSAKIAAKSAYMLANGSGKARATRSGTDKPVAKWRILFLSTGEMQLAAKLLEDRSLSHSAGMGVRMLDIPADAGAGNGLLNDTNGADPAHFIDAINAAAKADYGYAGAAFVEALKRHLKQPNGLAELRAYCDSCANDFIPKEASSQVRRAAERFALVALAGEYARAWGVLPWEQNTAYNGAKSAFDSWLEQRQTSGQLEPMQIISTVRAYIGGYGSSQFEEILRDKGGAGPPMAAPAPGMTGQPSHAGVKMQCAVQSPTNFHAGQRVHGVRAGFKRREKDGTTKFIILPTHMHETILPTTDKKMIRKTLAKCGALEVDGSGQLKSMRLPELGKVRVYIINPEALS